eukprot:4431487-Amphidinium_carterae.1
MKRFPFSCSSMAAANASSAGLGRNAGHGLHMRQGNTTPKWQESTQFCQWNVPKLAIQKHIGEVPCTTSGAGCFHGTHISHVCRLTIEGSHKAGVHPWQTCAQRFHGLCDAMNSCKVKQEQPMNIVTMFGWITIVLDPGVKLCNEFPLAKAPICSQSLKLQGKQLNIKTDKQN